MYEDGYQQFRQQYEKLLFLVKDRHNKKLKLLSDI